MRHENDLHRCPSECKNHSGGDSVAMGRVSLLPSALGTLLSGREREKKRKRKRRYASLEEGMHVLVFADGLHRRRVFRLTSLSNLGCATVVRR